MKAVTLPVHGGPDALRHGDVPDPTPAPDQVVVRVLACGICGHDSADRAGLSHVDLPVVLGHEICGEVVALGAAVRAFAVGERVNVHLESVFEKTINQDGLFGRSFDRSFHVLVERSFVIHDLHRASAQHVTGPHEHRITNGSGNALGFFG